MKKLPLGIYTFDKIMNGGFLYIDKTKLISELTQITEPLLLTRPKRFGKTLLLSAVKKFFKGQKKLFKGLWIDQENRHWPSYPIIHLDMAKINCKDLLNFRQTLITALTKLIKAENLRVKGQSPAEIFQAFIVDLAQSQAQKVVVLIDEYDLPIVANANNPENLTAIWAELVEFYQVPQQVRENLRFHFMVGVNRFDQKRLFPGFDNLRDITFDPGFSSICGISEQEFDQHFPPYLDVVMTALEAEGQDFGPHGLKKLRADLLDWYGGYSWDGQNKLMHLFFLLHFFRAKELNNFWHTAKTPSKLVTLVRKHDLASHLIAEDLTFSPEENVIDLENVLPVPALFQSGYLAVTKTAHQSGQIVHRLALPNLSARWLLFIYLMAKVYNHKAGHLWGEIDQLLKSLTNLNPKLSALALKRLLTSFTHGRMGKSGAEHYGPIFQYVMYVLGQPIPGPEPEGPQGWRAYPNGGIKNDLIKPVTGLVKIDNDAFLAMEMSYHILDRSAQSENLKGNETDHEYPDLDYDSDDEWRYPSEEILALEERLADRAKLALARLNRFEWVKRLRAEGLRVIPVALVVLGDSVVKVLMEKDQPGA
ncbi:MAG: AAA family ATPase [Deltaproteobacteria bacterium]|jgi:hypothetical protein|nr:AAA family ATPase [Deltaproteobacteria bacterium]